MYEFPQTQGLIYLNHAGVGPWPERTRAAVAEFAAENVALGASRYRSWLEVEERLRERFARLINAVSGDIALVKNTSEGLSLVAYGLDWRPGDKVIINRHEFPSNRIVWESLRERFGVEVCDVDLTPHDPEQAIIEAMDSRVRLLAVSSVQYASGLRMDLARLGEACRRQGVLFCVDAIQSLGALQFDATAIGADFVIADGHKWLLGPEGLGLFYSRPEARERLNLLQYGWHMVADAGNYDRSDWAVAPDARRFEAGSPNMLGIHALEASLSLFEEQGMAAVEAAILRNSRYLCELIQNRPDLELVTDPNAERLAGIVSFRLPGRDPRKVYTQLMERNVICAQRAGGIRFSPHFYNTPEQLEQALALALA
jgi:cysteine desulfurase / selenocysteine lyase